MVAIAAAIITKVGKPLLARAFVSNLTRARLEGLLAVLSKLISRNNAQRQHTCIETESVRYVYQFIKKIIVVLVTTKASNIFEDTKTLDLLSRIYVQDSRVLFF